MNIKSATEGEWDVHYNPLKGVGQPNFIYAPPSEHGERGKVLAMVVLMSDSTAVERDANTLLMLKSKKMFELIEKLLDQFRGHGINDCPDHPLYSEWIRIRDFLYREIYGAGKLTEEQKSRGDNDKKVEP